MIEVTVKTLDSKNHLFKVSEELTVKEFKDVISPTVSIPVDEQRLIFRGRVLQDDKKISEYNVANNTVHLVQRPNQPGGGGNQNDEPQRHTSNDDRFNLDGGSGIIITTVGEPTVNASPGGMGIPRRNSAAIRLQTGNEMINRASNLLQKLEEDDEITAVTSQSAASTTPSSSLSNATEESHDSPSLDSNSMEIDPDDPAALGRVMSQVANAASAVLASVRTIHPGASSSDSNPFAGLRQGVQDASTMGGVEPSSVNLGIPSSSQASTPRRQEAPRLREMAIALQDIMAFHERLTPFLQFVQNVLRQNSIFNPDTGELQSIQYAYDTVSSILHYLGHSYHAYSDLMCDFSTSPETRRLSAPASILVEQSTVVRATIPIAASFGPSLQQQQQSAPRTQSSSSTTATQNVPNLSTILPQAMTTGGLNFGQSQGGPTPGISINIQSNGMQDLASLFGPALADATGGGGGILPFLTYANLRHQAQQAQQQGRPPGPPQSQPVPSPNLGGVSGQPNSQPIGAYFINNIPLLDGSIPPLPQPISSAFNNNLTSSGNNNNVPPAAAGQTGGPNIQQSIRNELNANLMRSPFDILLSCHSHHTNRNRTRQRPSDLHQHVQVSQDSRVGVSAGEGTDDFFETIVELIRCSTWLEILQPYFKDVVQNYLMRGRDTTNTLHIKTCARSLAKKLMPFFQTVTDTITIKDDNIAYEITFSELASKFYFKLLRLVLNSGPTRQFRASVLLLWEESMSKLFSILRHCFPNNNRVPDIVAKLLVEQFFVGMPLIFRGYANSCLKKYFAAFSLSVEKDNTDAQAAGLIYKTTEASVDQDKSSSASSVTPKLASEPSTSQSGNYPTSSVSVTRENLSSPPVTQVSSSPKNAVTVEADSMETDIDDLLASPTPFSSSTTNDSPFRHIPTEWRDAVRHDIQRQMGMRSAPLSPSPGFVALFQRRN